MDFLKYTKKLINKKSENKTQTNFEQNLYHLNPFKQNKQVTYIWIEKDTS